MQELLLGGTFTLKSSTTTLTRMGYGAMRLAGTRSTPAPDPDRVEAVLRELVDSGVTHIDTSAHYGAHLVNRTIKQALHPYPSNLIIASKTAPGIVDGKPVGAFSRQDLIADVHANLSDLGLDVLDIFNLRVGSPLAPADFSVEEPLTVLAELKSQGLLRHIGLSNVTPAQVTEGMKVTEIVCVQNLYNLANRQDDDLIDHLAKQGVAYVPFFPLGGFSPLQSSALDSVAQGLHATSLQVALAWLLQRSPNILLIPGTSSVEHLRENLQAASLKLPQESVAALESISSRPVR